MPAISKFLDDSVVLRAKEGLKELGKSAIISRKLQAIISARVHGISKVASIYNVTNKTLTFWIKSLRNGSIADLKPKPKSTRLVLLGEVEKKIIQKWLGKEPNLTIKKIRLLIKKEMKIEVSKSTVHRLIRKLGFSHITARPIRYKQDKEKLEEFKKNSNRNSKKQSQ
jgi:transposase